MPRNKKMDRDDLLSKATAVIRKNGYRETSLDELAKEFHFTKPALYYYVDSKEALLYEIYEKTIREWLARIRRIASDKIRNPEEKIREVVRQFMHLCVEHDEMAIFFEEKSYLADEHFQAISAKEREVIEIIAGIIEEGIALGVMKPVPPKVVAYGLVGMTAWSYRWVSLEGPLTIDSLADTYYEVVIGGLLQQGL
ncbi:MAG: TetR/AcrR family transcriptional regulator [Firmicutes bacterium]|nr:TetR/AcrR family transcriptional regulator [Bacillota bacterium]MCL5971829.1 TetR/AcrR family transcriptional regulator [Bacillota bacterium]